MKKKGGANTITRVGSFGNQSPYLDCLQIYSSACTGSIFGASIILVNECLLYCFDIHIKYVVRVTN